MWPCQYIETWDPKQTSSIARHIVALHEWLTSIAPNRNVYSAGVMPITSYAKLILHKKLQYLTVRMTNSCGKAAAMQHTVTDIWFAWSVLHLPIFKATVQD